LHSFPISLKGVEKGDFTMVYGFPGRTQEYLTSYAVDLLINQQDPIRVGLREKRLDIIEAEIPVSDERDEIVNFIRETGRGIMRGYTRRNNEDLS
jgi:hypothetical protein